MSTIYPNDTHASPHFRWDELRCRCGCKPSDAVRARLLILAGKLEALRARVGKSVIVTNAHRCAKQNRKVGGATRSQHLYGNAADVVVHGLTVARLAEEAGKVAGLNGIGTYPADGFVHVDTRNSPARWVD